MSADQILQSAADAISQRAAQRDAEQERSMARSVAAFNALTGRDLTENEGWLFMAVLKMARATTPGAPYHADDYVDGAAYVALAGESRERK